MSPAQLGADDFAPPAEPQPDLLRDVTGIEPEQGALHVLLDKHLGTRSVQRLALARVNGGIRVGLWPAELKSQADALYTARRAHRVIDAASRGGWDVAARPCLAFFNSRSSQRLYMHAGVDPAEYARRWIEEDAGRFGRYERKDLDDDLLPWLRERGYLQDSDMPAFEAFLEVMGERPVDVRPGLRLLREWQEPDERTGRLTEEIRTSVNQLLRAADEPILPAPGVARASAAPRKDQQAWILRGMPDAGPGADAGILPQLGHVIAGCRLVEVIGRGGMGVVFRAEQALLGRAVAIKVINPVLAEQDEVRTRFVREARLGAAVEHPNALPVYAVGDEAGVLYIATRYVDGPDLASIIKREIYLAPVRAVRIIAQVADALDSAHATGLVHRDVKPHNILVANHGGLEHAYMTDFGLARHLLDTGLTGTGAALGTPAYMSPEQVLGHRVDARSDVYSLGVTLFHALTGVPPFDADSTHAVLFAHVHAPVPRPSEANTALGLAMDAVLMRALAKNPADRFPSAGDLARAANEALAGRSRSIDTERSVATGPAASDDEAAAPEFPGRITDAYIRVECPDMPHERFERFLALLRSRNWAESDLALRVYPHAPAGWDRSSRSIASAPAVIAVYEALDPGSRTRSLLHALPGGIEAALLPAEIGERIAAESGESFSKASVRAVMRNLQRLENRLLNEGAISRRILGKTFRDYDREHAGRYFLEPIDRDALDAHLRRAAPPARPLEVESALPAPPQIDQGAGQPRISIPLSVLETIEVELGGKTYRAEVRGAEVVVPGTRLRPGWARVVGDYVEITAGAAVPPLLDDIAPAERSHAVAGGLIVACVIGHPRRSPAGHPIRLLWGDHVALAAFGDPRPAMRDSRVRDPQPHHVLELGGAVVVRSAGKPDENRGSGIEEPVILIRVPRRHRPGMSEAELYEVTRNWWAMNPARHNPRWAFTVVGGVVRAVFAIERWEQDPASRRWQFHGAPDPAMARRYVGMDVTAWLPSGAQNPIRYVNC